MNYEQISKTLKQIAVAANADQPEPISDEMLWGEPQQTVGSVERGADSEETVETSQDQPEEVISLANTVRLGGS